MFSYNSVFYNALATNNYNVLYATPDFVNGVAYDQVKFPDSRDANFTDIQRNVTRYQKLSNAECIRQYGKDFVPDRRTVIAVVKGPYNSSSSLLDVTFNDFPLKVTREYNAFEWICDDPQTVNKTSSCCENAAGFIPCSVMVPKLEEISNVWWRSGGYDIDYCLSEQVPSSCHLHFAFPLILVVIGFNILKVIGVAYVCFRLPEDPLVTIGDAIQSFITKPDPYTKGMCLGTKDTIERYVAHGNSPPPARYRHKGQRWYRAATYKQWTFVMIL